MLLAKLNVLKSLNSVTNILRLVTLTCLISTLAMASLTANAEQSKKNVEDNATLAAQTVVARNGETVTTDLGKALVIEDDAASEKGQSEPSNADIATTESELNDTPPVPSLSRLERPEVGKHVAANNLDAGGMLLSLLMVLALIVVAATVLKKFRMVPQLGKGMKVITSMHLGPKERLVVVEVNEKQLLLGVTAHNISILQQLETPLTPAQPLPTELATGLSKLLKK